MKTVGQVFPSSYVESKYLPSIGGDVLRYEGKTYTLVDQCLPVLSDKTEDERYFILSLIAIGKELADDAELMRTLTPHDHIKVELLIGLPLQHYEAFVAVILLVWMIIIFLQKNNNVQGTYDSERNIVYSQKGTYGTAGWMTDDELHKELEVTKSLKHSRGTRASSTFD